MMASCYGTANSYQTLGSLPETACEPDSVSCKKKNHHYSKSLLVSLTPTPS